MRPVLLAMAALLASSSAQAALCSFDDDADPLCEINGGLQWINLGGQPTRTSNAPTLSPSFALYNNFNDDIGVVFDEPSNVDSLNIVTWARFQPDVLTIISDLPKSSSP